MRFNSQIEIEGRKIGMNASTYFIADIAANHDNDLERAKELIHLAAEAGADAVKFQHFTAKTIVSDYGFKTIGKQKSHQAKWSKTVFEVYKNASLNLEWTPILKETCEKAGTTFFTSPYSLELVDNLDSHVPAIKIGSGDITWWEIIKHISEKGKPVLLATGASTIDEIVQAVNIISEKTGQLVLMQCNTSYTGSFDDFKYINLNVLKTYRAMYPEVILGLSDHTIGHTTVLGAVTLGASVIEKHFTDDNTREGPDHPFAMNPSSWKEMVKRTRELELSLGYGVKKVEQNESETVVLQRRAIRVKQALQAGTILQKKHIVVLRPCPLDALSPNKLNEIMGKALNRDIKAGEYIKWIDLK